MPDIQHSRQLREERAKVIRDAQAVAADAQKEDRSLSSDDKAKIDALSARAEELMSQIETYEKVEDLQVDLDAPATRDGGFQLADGRIVDKVPADRDEVITYRDEQNALRAMGLGSQATAEQVKAREKVFGSTKQAGDKTITDVRLGSNYDEMRRDFRENGMLTRATGPQSVGTDAKGGYGVPTLLSRRIEEALLNYGGMRSVATVFRTAGGGDFNVMTADDTTTLAAVLAENNSATGSDLSFNQVTFYAAKYTSGVVRSSIELLQDEAVDIVSYIGKALGDRLARGTNADYTTGSTATTSPRGVLRASVAGYSATTGDLGANASGVAYYSLVELKHSVDIEYRNRPGAGWMMHDGIFKEVVQLVDSNGLPLLQPSVRAGAPDMILGHPVTINNRLVSSSTGAGETLMLFGDLAAYGIRDVADISLLRFDELFMQSLQVGWLAYMRTDGVTMVASTRTASKPIKHLVGTT